MDQRCSELRVPSGLKILQEYVKVQIQIAANVFDFELADRLLQNVSKKHQPGLDLFDVRSIQSLLERQPQFPIEHRLFRQRSIAARHGAIRGGWAGFFTFRSPA
jgi:hypothetical protein